MALHWIDLTTAPQQHTVHTICVLYGGGVDVFQRLTQCGKSNNSHAVLVPASFQLAVVIVFVVARLVILLANCTCRTYAEYISMFWESSFARNWIQESRLRTTKLVVTVYNAFRVSPQQTTMIRWYGLSDLARSRLFAFNFIFRSSFFSRSLLLCLVIVLRWIIRPCSGCSRMWMRACVCVCVSMRYVPSNTWL